MQAYHTSHCSFAQAEQLLCSLMARGSRKKRNPLGTAAGSQKLKDNVLAPVTKPGKAPPATPASGSLLDRLLTSRVESFGAGHGGLDDIDRVVNGLRQIHKEYARHKPAAFKQLVERAIDTLRARNSGGKGTDGGKSKPHEKQRADGEEAVSEQLEGATSSDDSSDDSLSNSGDEGSWKGSSSSSGDEEDRRSEPPAGLNSSLLSMYAKATGSTEGQEDRAGPLQGTAAEKSSKRRRSTSPPAFAPPEVVAAAAARALAAERAAKEAKANAKSTGKGTSQQQQEPDDRGISGNTAGAGPGPPPVTHTTHPQLPGKEGAPAAAQQVQQGADASAGEAKVADTQGEGMAPGTGPAPEAPVAGGKARARRAAEEAPRTAGKKRPRRAPSSTTPGRPPGFAGMGMGGGGGGGGGSAVVPPRAVTYADLGGVEEVLADIRELIEYPLKHPEVYAWLGVEPPRGVLLHGPPGCGKTALANAIANECGVPFLRVSAPEIVSGMSGESEAKLRALFQEAADLAPCIVFIDEIDAIAPKRETAQREMERRIVAQMLTCMDDLSAPPADTPDAQAGGGEAAQEAAGQEGSEHVREGRPHVVVIGATNRPDALDPALRRAGRFDREIALGIPSESARAQILRVISRRLRLEGNFDFGRVAKRTPGFVGADLMALVKEAAALAVTRIFSSLIPAPAPGAPGSSSSSSQAGGPEGGSAPPVPQAQRPQLTAGVGGVTIAQAAAAAAAASSEAGSAAPSPQFGGGPLTPAQLAGLAITMSDFETAVSKVQPSVRREGFTTRPDVTWEDVGSLDEVRDELSFAICQPILHPERFEALGLAAATGVLLYGPPGCGKTLVAKAVAAESGANFISIKGPELLNKYVGESERAVRQLFARARAAHPCVLFFDELDALAPRRGTDTNQAAERVVNQLLTEMDGIDGRQGVFVVAATNRPDMIDPALLRPGRLDKVLYVPLPPPEGRASILCALTRRTPLAPGVDVGAVGLSERCSGFSGADLAALVREAAVLALKEEMAAHRRSTAPQQQQHQEGGVAAPGTQPPALQVYMRHFEAALGRVSPSVSRKDARVYEALRRSLRGNNLAPNAAPAAAADRAEPAGAEGTDAAAGTGPLGSEPDGAAAVGEGERGAGGPEDMAIAN